jgi:hypothetical protein
MLLFPTTTASLLVVIQHPTSSYAITTEGYDNPNYPSPPEERCEHSLSFLFFLIAKAYKNDDYFFPFVLYNIIHGKTMIYTKQRVL